MQNVKSVTKLSELAKEFQEIILKMRDYQFGVITDLRIANGRPRLETAHVVRRVRLTTSKPVIERLSNFQLSRQHTDFVALVESIHDGMISKLEFQNGLPCHIDVRE